MKKKIKELLKAIRRRIPISRSRYEREISFLKLSVSRSVEDERNELRHMIQRIANVSCYPGDQMTRLRIELRVTDDLYYATRSPAFRGRLFYEIAERAARDLEASMGTYKIGSTYLGQ